jgi:hypothetical protein
LTAIKEDSILTVALPVAALVALTPHMKQHVAENA